MNGHIEHILRCPITKGALRKMDMDEIMEVNSRISKGQLFDLSGNPVKTQIVSGFVSLNGQFVYPVVDDIVILLQDLAIVVNSSNLYGSANNCLKQDKEDVQDFYDKIGWRKEGEVFCDAIKFEDLRSVSKDYIHKCHLRVNKYLKHDGKYILDVASGPIQYPEYLTYSNGFDFRVCVDFSFLALQEAKRKLGNKGIYLLGDICNLPLKDSVVDAVTSLHTIYHVPKDEQHIAFYEIYRVLQPESSAVVVYSWGRHSLLMSIALLPSRIFRAIPKMIVRIPKKLIAVVLNIGKNTWIQESSVAPEPRVYYHAHTYKYFIEQKWTFDFNIIVWRSISVPFMKTYIHSWLFGKQILALINWLEEKYPYLAGRIGQYPLFIIRK